jgi:hypothetical protein
VGQVSSVSLFVQACAELPEVAGSISGYFGDEFLDAFKISSLVGCVFRPDV